MPNSFNDIDVLQPSSLMTQIALGEDQPVEFEENGHKYNYDYFLGHHLS
jgi:hypothetical protein